MSGGHERRSKAADMNGRSKTAVMCGGLKQRDLFVALPFLSSVSGQERPVMSGGHERAVMSGGHERAAVMNGGGPKRRLRLS